MKMLGMLCAVADGGDTGMIIISPTDDLWFVNVDTFPPDFEETRKAIEAKGMAAVVGAICGKGDA